MQSIGPSMDVAIPIHHKGRSYWPPVFFDSQTNKLDSPSLAAFGECVLSHFGSQDNHIHENGGGKEERRAATFDTYKDTCRSAVWNTDWIDNQTWRLRDKYYKCGDGAFTSLSHEMPALAATVLLLPLPPMKVGVAVVIENQFHRVLITRRSSTMRTFPNVWVVPGGHMNIGETLAETAVREVFEETGLQINKDQVSLLAVYESVFPVLLATGPPTDHHIVVYMKAVVDMPETTLCLQVFEVNAAAWISKDTVISALQIDPSHPQGSGYVETFQAFELENTVNVTSSLEITTSLLRQTMYSISQLQSTMRPDGTVPMERLSTGCRFALREWLQGRR